MKKSVQILYFIILAVFFLAPVLVYKAFGSHFDQTNYTNDTLAVRPTLALNKASIDAYPDAFDDWFSDNLPFKNELLEISGHLDYDVLGSTTSDSVIIGKDGWLFYRGSQVDGEDPIADYAGANLFTDEELARIAANLEAARDYLLEMNNCRFVIYLAPNKERIYSDKMPDSFGEPQYSRIQQVYDYLTENTDLNVATGLDALLAYREENPDDQVYFKYDTHWNQLGAYIGAQPLAEKLGYTLPPVSELTREDLGKGNFDLSRLLHLGDYLSEDHAYVLTGYSDEVNHLITEHNDDYNQFYYYNTTNDAEHEVVYFVGDSFSSNLSPYIACEYNNTYVDFYYNYKFQTLQDHNPTIFIYETVERYMGNLVDFSIFNGIGNRN